MANVTMKPMADRTRKVGQTSKLTLWWPVPRVVKRVALASVILVVVLLIAGGVYTYFTDQHQVANQSQTTSASQTNYHAFKKPVLPGPNTAVGAAIEELTTPVYPGSTATVAATTDPVSKCSISLLVNNVSSPSLALAPQTSDDYGSVSWSWVVKNSTPIGTWPLKIICVHGSKSGVVEGNITITSTPSGP